MLLTFETMSTTKSSVYIVQLLMDWSTFYIDVHLIHSNPAMAGFEHQSHELDLAVVTAVPQIRFQDPKLRTVVMATFRPRDL